MSKREQEWNWKRDIPLTIGGAVYLGLGLKLGEKHPTLDFHLVWLAAPVVFFFVFIVGASVGEARLKRELSKAAKQTPPD